MDLISRDEYLMLEAIKKQADIQLLHDIKRVDWQGHEESPGDIRLGYAGLLSKARAHNS